MVSRAVHLTAPLGADQTSRGPFAAE